MLRDTISHEFTYGSCFGMACLMVCLELGYVWLWLCKENTGMCFVVRRGSAVSTLKRTANVNRFVKPNSLYSIVGLVI